MFSHLDIERREVQIAESAYGLRCLLEQEGAEDFLVGFRSDGEECLIVYFDGALPELPSSYDGLRVVQRRLHKRF